MEKEVYILISEDCVWKTDTDPYRLDKYRREVFGRIYPNWAIFFLKEGLPDSLLEEIERCGVSKGSDGFLAFEKVKRFLGEPFNYGSEHYLYLLREKYPTT